MSCGNIVETINQYKEVVMSKVYEVLAYRNSNPVEFRKHVINALCFEEAVGRAYAWRTRQGIFHEWHITSVSLSEDN